MIQKERARQKQRKRERDSLSMSAPRVKTAGGKGATAGKTHLVLLRSLPASASLGPDLRSVQARKYWTESHAQRSRGTKSSAGGRETAPRRPFPAGGAVRAGAMRRTGRRRHRMQQRLRNAADGQGAELQNSGACARAALRAKASARKMPSRCSTRWRKMPSRSEGYGVSKTGKMQGNCESSRLGRCKAHVCAAF